MAAAEPRLEAVFEWLGADQDGDGKVTAAELVAYITAEWAKAGERAPAAGSALMAQGIVRAHDQNGDGAIGPEDSAP